MYSMQRTHTSDFLALALVDLVGMLNSPRQDEILLREAGVSLDRALFPLLVRIGMAKSISVAGLAEQVGRDHSTVSRQTAKLETLGLIRRTPGKSDQRVREATISAEGRTVMMTITKARRRLMGKVLAGWSKAEVQELTRLNRKLADRMRAAYDSAVIAH
jgi:DNA-binding MarR family transcriptional regulator